MTQSQTGPRLSRTYVIGLAALSLVLATVMLGLHLGLQTRAQFREIWASWFDCCGDARQKEVWISFIHRQLR